MSETPTTTPHSGQVWRAPDTGPMLFVRSERRPGHELEHLFIFVRDRTVTQRWHLATARLPPAFDLIADPKASKRAAELEQQLHATGAERDALAEAMRRAVAIVPADVAAELRRVYRETLGRFLVRG